MELRVGIGDETFGVEEIHFRRDVSVGLNVVIAIHSTVPGPALGGCRCIPYPDSRAAVNVSSQIGSAVLHMSAVLAP